MTANQDWRGKQRLGRNVLIATVLLVSLVASVIILPDVNMLLAQIVPWLLAGALLFHAGFWKLEANQDDLQNKGRGKNYNRNIFLFGFGLFVLAIVASALLADWPIFLRASIFIAGQAALVISFHFYMGLKIEDHLDPQSSVGEAVGFVTERFTTTRSRLKDAARAEAMRKFDLVPRGEYEIASAEANRLSEELESAKKELQEALDQEITAEEVAQFLNKISIGDLMTNEQLKLAYLRLMEKLFPTVDQLQNFVNKATWDRLPESIKATLKNEVLEYILAHVEDYNDMPDDVRMQFVRIWDTAGPTGPSGPTTDDSDNGWAGEEFLASIGANEEENATKPTPQSVTDSPAEKTKPREARKVTREKKEKILADDKSNGGCSGVASMFLLVIVAIILFTGAALLTIEYNQNADFRAKMDQPVQGIVDWAEENVPRARNFVEGVVAQAFRKFEQNDSPTQQRVNQPVTQPTEQLLPSPTNMPLPTATNLPVVQPPPLSPTAEPTGDLCTILPNSPDC